MMVAQLRVDWREPALAKGWLQRAARLLGTDRKGREFGYLSFLQCRLALLQNDLAAAIILADRARDVGRACEDRDLESLGLLYGGEARLYDGAVEDGLAAIDEAGATVVGCSPRPWVGGLVYCGIIYSSLTRADWHRAAQWNDHFDRWCSLNGCQGARGLCELHRAELMCVQGDLGGAEREACRAQQTLAHRSPWAEGDAWRVLGEIHLARGDWAAARVDFTRAQVGGWNTELGQAGLAHAKGDDEQACRLLARALGDNHWANRARRGMLLAHFAIFAAAAGRFGAAADALSEIERRAELTATSALQALVERARGDLALVRGDCAAAIQHFRMALRTMRDINAPLAAAQIQLRLAEALGREGDVESANLEASAARTTLRDAEAFGLLSQVEHALNPAS
jgi:tetratricopeptide (TPR) repeat protein